MVASKVLAGTGLDLIEDEPSWPRFRRSSIRIRPFITDERPPWRSRLCFSRASLIHNFYLMFYIK